MRGKNLHIQIYDKEEGSNETSQVQPIKTSKTTARGQVSMKFGEMPSTATSRYYQQQNISFQQPHKKEEIIVKTIVKQENNGEIYMTDVQDVDYD
jgi:hypothetical protein